MYAMHDLPGNAAPHAASLLPEYAEAPWNFTRPGEAPLAMVASSGARVVDKHTTRKR